MLTLILFVFVFLIFFILKSFTSIDSQLENLNLEISNVDITEPRFAINNDTKKIFVSAKEGNFITDDKILLRKKVKFKSNDFSIETDNVMFNKKKQTASSKHRSTFKSKNTIISSQGFDIYDNGNSINFYGSSKVILK